MQENTVWLHNVPISYFKKRSLKKNIVLHEFYHHLAHNNIVSSKGEEQKAEKYARKMIKI